MESTNQSHNPGNSDNPTASGLHFNSRALDLVPGSSVISEPQHNSNRTYNQPTSEQHAPSDVALTTAGRPRQRRKWTTDINENLLRAYYIVTDQERNTTGYRTQLREIFVAQHPDYDVSEQRLSDQIRTIIRNNLIPEIRRNALKASLLVTPNNHGTIPHQAQGTLNAIESPVDNQSQEIEPVTSEALSEILSDIDIIFEQQYDIYKDIDPLTRPSIPKINTCKKLSQIIEYINNKVIARKISQVNNLEGLHTLIYTSAVTVSIKMGYKIRYTENNRRTQVSTPNRTLQRIGIKINKLRSDLERLNSYIKGTNTKRLKNKILRIFEAHKRHSRYELNNKNAILTRDTIKQKLVVQVTRQRKYKLSNQRRINNETFKTNEKSFYRRLNIKNNGSEIDTLPNREDTERYWASIWSNDGNHNTNANWINEEKQRYQYLEEMTVNTLTCEQVKQIILKTHNWKSPGPDKIQNYWFKKLTTTHQKLTELLNECIQEPRKFPQKFATGITYLLAKEKGFRGNPANGRPITCLPTIYKIMTASLSLIINNHLTQNNILCEEQKGCCKYAKGCKEQLTIDQVVLEQTTRQTRNLHACFIDYQKAFDSVPHSWLIQSLKIYKIHPTLIEFLKHNMTHWQTSIQISSKSTYIKTAEIKIKCGIFQGDCLSPLWFCIALNPLSNLLKNSKYGFKIKGNSTQEVLSHLLYMDDLKMYSSTKQSLEQLIEIVSMFSDDINMKFGLDKCKTIRINKGKITKSENRETLEIKEMDENELYKYLGMVQNNRIDVKTVKTSLMKEFKARIHKIAKTNLNGKNLIKAVNTYAVPILSYSFGIIKWTVTEIQSLQRKIRTMLTHYKFHHPKSCVERMITPRKEGGRGLVDLQTLHDNQVQSLRDYFHLKSQRSTLIKTVTEADKNLTPLNLSGHFERQYEDKSVREQNWAIKPIHGRYYRAIHAENVDKFMSHKWLLNGNLYAETEAFMIAIQDQVIPTKNYIKYVIKDPNITDDKCRRCGNLPETIDHIISGCTSLAQNEYTRRHNNVAKILHMKLLEKHKIHHEKTPYYKYDPTSVVENENVKIYYDRTIYTDHTRLHNRPDITVLDKKQQKAIFIDVAIPATRNINRTHVEKCSRYVELAVETKRNWNLTEVKILPVVISAEGVVDKNTLESINTLGLNKNIIDAMQKSVIIDTCHITRKTLNIN